MAGRFTRTDTESGSNVRVLERDIERAQTKVERERDFHNKVYTESTRRRIWGFYDTNRASLEHFQLLVRGPSGLQGARVLEIGAGLSTQAFWMVEEGAHVTGIDVSDVVVGKVRDRARELGLEDRCDFQVMDAEDLAFEPGSFDVVCGNSVIHHLDLEKVYAGAAEVLKPGGRAVWREPLGHNPLLNAFRRLTPRMRTADEHPLVMDDLELAARWFSPIDGRFFHLTTPAAVVFRNSPRFRNVLRRLERVDAWLMPAGRRGLHRFAWFVVVRMVKPAG
jgi:2-polyprenyl-3-methyl-5-hydroxy-6-metoxy-1,4-benzoquinol methylase